MKLQYRSYPDFYKQRKCVIKEDDASIFVGRKVQMQSFWNELVETTTSSSKNYGIIGQRKMGKTASLARFFNVAFWEQNQVIPLYFAFTNSQIEIVKVADKIVFAFFKQFISFLFKDLRFLKIKDFDHLQKSIRSIENEETVESLLVILNGYFSSRNEIIKRGSENYLLREAFQVVIDFVDWFEMPCMCIIDEMQEMATGAIVNSKGEPINDPWSLERVAEDPRIWTIISGSKVSMLHHEIIRRDIANRIESVDFFPLTKEETHELVHKMIAKYSLKNVYNGIEKDVHEICGGYPFYVISMFKDHWKYTQVAGKEKSFTNSEELREVFLFEATHKKGVIYQFWAEHFAENAEKLNCAPPNRPGLTYDILCYLMDHDEVSYKDLMRVFDLTNKEAHFRRQQLINSDLFYSLDDRMLRLILPQIQYQKFDKASTKNDTSPEMLRLVNKKLNIFQDEIKQEVKKVKVDVKKVKVNVAKIDKTTKSLSGDVNRLKGGKLEKYIKDAIKAEKAPLKGYQVVGDLDKIYVGQPRKKEFEIDIAGKLKIKGKKQSNKSSIGLAVEVKDRKNKINRGDALKFIEALKKYKKQKKLTKVVAIFVNRSGFSKPVHVLLKKHNILAVGIEDFGS